MLISLIHLGVIERMFSFYVLGYNYVHTIYNVLQENTMKQTIKESVEFFQFETIVLFMLFVF